MIKTYDNIVQGSDEWIGLRCGILTASEIKLILTPTLKTTNNDKSRTHVFELASQRITNYVEPKYISDDMLRGHEEECYAKMHYANHFAEVKDVGFITNDKFGFVIGYSPDGLVGDDGIIEVKSRNQKHQLQTILAEGVPDDNSLNCMLQIQTGLLVSERKWCDFISYSGGMPMATYRVYPDLEMQQTIIEAATKFELDVTRTIDRYKSIISDKEKKFIPTERTIRQEIEI